ncbi:MAG: YbhB/YbcL family Raf kinase inhibitor-like protein [Gammaproteobacteria bacterium]
MIRKIWLCFSLCLGLTHCSASSSGMILTSSAFSADTPIPRQYTCQGDDISPPLAWQHMPKGAKSLALTVEDPDAPAGLWTHWVVYNLPPQTTQLAAHATLPQGTQQGLNSWNQIGYRGPCPPSGTHRYVFTLFALDAVLSTSSALNNSQLQAAMKSHILAKATLTTTYTRS